MTTLSPKKRDYEPAHYPAENSDDQSQDQDSPRLIMPGLQLGFTIRSDLPCITCLAPLDKPISLQPLEGFDDLFFPVTRARDNFGYGPNCPVPKLL